MQFHALKVLGISFVVLGLSACTIGGSNVEVPSLDKLAEEITEPSMTAIEFNDKMIELQETTLKPAEEFGLAVGEGIGSGEIDSAKLSDTLDAVHEEFDRAYDEMLAMEVPDYPGAQEFYDEMMNFMDVERDQVVDVYFQQIYDVMVDDTLTIEQKGEEVKRLFTELGPIEDEALSKLQAAQQSFADQNDFSLE